MTPNTKVQFVTFETTLPAKPFMERWKEYKRSLKSDEEVTLQQTEHNGGFRYIAQHRFPSETVQFVFTKSKRSSSVPQENIKLNKAGGYSILQAEKLTGASPNETKVFAFITEPRTDLNIYKELAGEGKLNIYEPYYLSCKFAYILEYFINKNKAEDLTNQLKKLDTLDVAIYDECNIPKNSKVTEKQAEAFEWPS